MASLTNLGSMVVGVLITFLSGVLKKAVNNLWDELWEYIFKAVVETEAEWGSKNGQQKKEWAIDKIMGWLEINVNLNIIQRIAAKLIIGNLINAVIDQFNEYMGHDWLAKAEELKQQLEDKLPIIE